MSRLIQRRNLLLSMTAVPAAALFLGGCNDSSAEASSEASSPDGMTTASVNVPDAQGSADIDALMQEGPMGEKTLGDKDAPVTIIEYASMTCGHCASFHNNTYPTIKEKYIDTGKVYFILREFPFDPRAEAGFMLARCADDKYFAMVDVLFKQQNVWAPAQDARSALLNIAKLAGFSQESFTACLTNQELLNDVRKVRARAAEEFGVEATPTFFINGKKYAGALSIDEMSAIIDSML